MFSLRLPITTQNTVTPSPKINNHSPRPYFYSFYPRSQIHQFPSQSLIKLGNTPWNVALQNTGLANTEESAEPELEPFPEELRPEKMPKHVAVTVDGHGRWANLRGLPVPEGHKAGVGPLMRFVHLCLSWGIKVVTVYAFSTENWTRSKVEVASLIRLFEATMASNIDTFQRYGIRMRVIGDTTKLPSSVQGTISYVEKTTKDNLKLHLTVAFNYGGRYDIVQACKGVAKKIKDGLVQLEDINENMIEQGLGTSCTEYPNPDLLIRPSGELRVSNFLLWQMVYAELFFSPKLWPDFGKDEFVEALSSFQHRQRRYGGRH